MLRVQYRVYDDPIYHTGTVNADSVTPEDQERKRERARTSTKPTANELECCCGRCSVVWCNDDEETGEKRENENCVRD